MRGAGSYLVSYLPPRPIDTGLDPQTHGVTCNDTITRLPVPDIFSEERKAGGVIGSVTHSFWSEKSIRFYKKVS